MHSMLKHYVRVSPVYRICHFYIMLLLMLETICDDKDEIVSSSIVYGRSLGGLGQQLALVSTKALFSVDEDDDGDENDDDD